MNKSMFKHIIREKVKTMLAEAAPAPAAPAGKAPAEKVGGSADFSAVAKTLGLNPQQITSAVNLVKQGKALNAAQNKILADLVINMVKTSNDKLVQDFANQVKKLEVKENKDTSINESFLYMQKLAGVITEAQYKAKIK